MQREEVDALYADSALLRDLAEGAKLPDSPGLTYRMGADNIRASFISVDIPTVNRPLYISIKEAGLRNWRGRHMEEAVLTDLRLRIDGQDGLVLDSLSQSGIVLPEEALLRRLSRLFGAPPDQRSMQALFQEMLAADEPLFRELRLNGLTMPLPEDRAELKTGSFEWLSNRPARYRINLSVPARGSARLRPCPARSGHHTTGRRHFSRGAGSGQHSGKGHGQGRESGRSALQPADLRQY